MILKTAQQKSHFLIFLLLLLEVKFLLIIDFIHSFLTLAILPYEIITSSSSTESILSLSLSIPKKFDKLFKYYKSNPINLNKQQLMQKKIKRTIIASIVSLVIITVILVLLGLGKVQLDQNALNYNVITANYSDTTLYGPGLYWIGIANRFLRFNKNQQTLRFSNLQAFSSDFYKITANMEVTLQFNFSTADPFTSASNFLILFGENSLDIINPLIKNQILVLLSSKSSSFYQSSTQPNSILQATLSATISTILGQWLGATVNVIVESVICEGSTSNTEIIDRDINSLIHDMQRTLQEDVQLSEYFNNTYANKLQQITSASIALNQKALQLQRIYQLYGGNTTGLNISHIIYDNKPLKYNLNLVDILEDLAKIANRTFPY